VSQLIESPSRGDDRVAVIDYRVAQLERRASDPAPPPRRKDAWERLQAIGPLLTGVVVALLGYWLTDSVNAALKRQELQLSNAREMRELVATLLNVDTTGEQADVAAMTMSAFGPPAVAPLVTALFAGGDVRAPAAERALRAVGLSTPDAVCRPMISILDNHTGRFTWLTHLSAIRLIGDLECPRAQTVLQRYARLLEQVRGPETVAAYAAIVDSEPPVDVAAVDQVKGEMQRTLKILQGH
jgi:hypothetical protein